MSGVCDLNGCIEQLAVGAIMYNTTWYLRAQNAKLVDYTKDNVNTTNSSVYRSTSVFSGDRNVLWGAAGQNAFFTDKNGDKRTLCGLTPAGSATTGINEFGKDRAYWFDWYSNYGAMRCGGSWSGSSGAGVWYRYVYASSNYGWVNAYAAWGFRAALYGKE